MNTNLFDQWVLFAEKRVVRLATVVTLIQVRRFSRPMKFVSQASVFTGQTLQIVVKLMQRLSDLIVVESHAFVARTALMV